MPLVILALALVAAAIGGPHLLFALRHESTDDAQLDGHLSPVLARVSGEVVALLVADNERVTAGQALLRLDTRDHDVRMAAAEAALAQARAQLASERTLVAVVEANIDADAVTLANLKDDFVRDSEMFKTGVISDRDFRKSKADAENASAKHTALLRQLDAARARVTLAEAAIPVREADLAAARLQRSYTDIVAPIAGRVSRRSVEPGQFVQAGTPLLTITGDEDVWVTANFKETQTGKMRPGQTVTFEVDAYPGVEFHGHVDSLSGATGAKFALLPPDNATGNFVKVTQRVPVKVVIDDADNTAHPLRPGLSADVSVLVKQDPRR
ncbi:secretion protein HlyD [Opitutaceae bacterium TAV5]|nr:secretion protein HlyD [Opitutaceae bacterium TAV5]